ncbi:MAG: hypothetical protein IMZ43_02055 [Thermoplasmata archaeon]|nr:hypothetical protein [Thermoplasmata archaeon]MBE3136166.1 hypothetical protein [Thermoplasmata archaeon]
MVFEKFSEWAAQFSIEDIFRGDFSSFLPLLYLAVSIAIYSILIWHFYRFIAKRDIFKISPRKHAKIIHFLKYSLLFPFLASLFFIGFSLMLLFLAKNLEIATILSTSFAIIIAIRMTAYYNEDLSKDLAKLMPFVLLGVFLVDPSYFSWSDIMSKINSLPEFFAMGIQFILLIMIIEWILRIVSNIIINIRLSRKKPSLKK